MKTFGFGGSDLRPLNEDHIRDLYERAKSDEPIFRNILLAFSLDQEYPKSFYNGSYENCVEPTFLQTASLEDIFQKLVRVGGRGVIRVEDFTRGPRKFSYSARNEIQLGENQAIIRVETSSDGWLDLYEISGESNVELRDRLIRGIFK